MYRIKDPNGNIVVGPAALPLSGNGHIDTYTEAVNGPSGIVGASGYSSLVYNPLMTGDYYIEFNFSTGWGGSDRCKFRYFDITVSTFNNLAIDGRVWSKAWQMTADDFNNPFWGTLFVYADDGVVTSIDFNGMEPFVFAVSCNPWGCYNTGNFIQDRRSVNGNHTLTQYKIFLNDPDPVAYPTGTLGTVVPPIVVTPSCSGESTIQIEVTKAGNLDILLNLNPDPGVQPEDVQISQPVSTGTNTIIWNGLNGLNQPVPNGTTFDIFVTYINGLTNLPIYDVEQNPGGFIIELERPSGSVPPVFWDDILIGGGQNFDGCTFIPPSTGCHTFGSSVGDTRTVNTWWYAVTSESPAVEFTELREPQSPGTITGISSLCPGTASLEYWVHLEPNSDSTIWSYSGTGATITVMDDTTIHIDYQNNATSGTLSVVGYNDDCGSGTATSTLSITIYPAPVVSLDPYTPICIDEPPFALFGGSPAGGTYTINSIPVTTFDPAIYGTGSHEVYYTYTDGGTGCTADAHKPLVVNPLPAVTLPQLPGICINEAPVILSGGTPANGIYSGPGVSNDSIFDPETAGFGTHTITYTFTDGSGCTNSDDNTITVFDVTPVDLPPFGSLCINASPITLTGGTPIGGTYSGTGVSGGIFDPSVTGAGTFEIVYSYTDGNNCTNSDTNTITVNPLPAIPGPITGTDTTCQGTTGDLYSIAPVSDAISYEWLLDPPTAGTITGTTTQGVVDWSATFSGAASLTVRGINTCGDGPTAPSFLIQVNPGPDVTFVRCFDSVTTTDAQPITLKGGIPLNGTFTGPGISGGILYPALAGSGTHTITYTYINDEGCLNQAARSITIQTPLPWNCGDSLTDIRDGQKYATAMIQTQCWMAQNLNYGTQLAGSQSQRDNCIPEKYCYNDDPGLCASGSALYQWNEIMNYTDAEANQGLCPPGWHIPTETEWLLLFNQFTSSGFAGSALKYSGYSGFNALMTGFSVFNQSWKYPFTDAVLRSTIFWSSTSHTNLKAWAHGMNEVVADDDYTPSVSYYPSYRNNAFSVRCIKD